MKWLVFGVIVALAVACLGAPPQALITNLPGFNGTANFAQYSGYITVNATQGRALFYWFVESQNNPATDPVLLWLQGGPGCSGLLGLVTENGPFRVVPGNPKQPGLAANAYSWNRIANVIYVESPAGVGFSYSNTSADYNTDNTRTAVDSYNFLRNWLLQYPEYSTNDIYLTGESYAGDYVPQLAKQILDGPDQSLVKQFKGFMIGNPVMSCPLWKLYRDSIQVDLFYYHGSIPIDLYNRWQNSNCAGKSVDTPLHCELLLAEMRAGIGRNDPDNLYQDFCTGNATLDFTETYPDCVPVQDLCNRYFNLADVRLALHAGEPAHAPWKFCTPDNFLNYTTLWPDMNEYYLKFFKQAPYLKILIYSGDVDIATVPHAATQLCLNSLNSPITQKWRPWVYNELQQVGGYIEVHEHFTFVTIKGAGHMVPQYAPMSAYRMLEHYLLGKTLPAIILPKASTPIV